MQIIQLILRGWQFLFVLLTTALIGNVIDDAFSGNPSSINYAIFVSVFCWIVLITGIAHAMEKFPGKIQAAMDGFAALFTVIAGIVLAAKLNVHSCDNNSYLRGNSLTNGSNDPSKRCTELQASCAFYWFLFPAFAVSALMAFMNGGSMNMRRGGMRKGGPSMTQV